MIDDNVKRFCADRALQVEAAKHLVDGTAGLLADRTNIYVDDEGTVYGADAAVSALLKKKPHLTRANPPVPPPTSVANLPPPGSKEAADAITAWKEKWCNSATKGKDIQSLCRICLYQQILTDQSLCKPRERLPLTTSGDLAKHFQVGRLVFGGNFRFLEGAETPNAV